MSKSLLIITLSICSLFAVAQSKDAKAEIANIYKEYELKQTELFSGELTKKNLATKLDRFVRDSESSLERISTLEVNEKLELSPEGSQVALDLELIKPLVNFSKSAMSKEDCALYANDNALNQQDGPEPVATAVENILKKLCIK